MRLKLTGPVLSIWLLATAAIVGGQEYPVKISTGAESTRVSMEYLESHFIFTSRIEHFLLNPDVDQEGFSGIDIPGCYLSGDVGGPALPQISRLFEAGQEQTPVITITRMDSLICNLNQLGISEKLAPLKPSVRKGEPMEKCQVDRSAYEKDLWLGRPVISVVYEGTMRGLPLSRLLFSPVQYNPARNMVKVYYNIDCTIELQGSVKSKQIPSEAFRSIFSRVVRDGGNGNYGGKKAVFSEGPMTLVILSDTLFRETLQPFIQWKSRKGFRVLEAYRQDPAVGSSRESIKSYLRGIYTDPPVGFDPTTFLLIVGDVEHIPLFQSGGEITDLYYSEYDGGGDYIPEVFSGRISVSSTGQLETVLEKILQYEQYLFTDPSFLDESVLIAGMDGDFASKNGNGQINYAQHYYFNEKNGNNANTFLYPESGSKRQEIIDLISGGIGFVNYTGHGEYNKWKDPAFLQSDIDSLKNRDKYPVMIGNGCETNIFSLDECFAEALLRAPKKGALAYIGCTNDSYWDEDYYWSVGVGPINSHPLYEETSQGYYDRVFHTHGEASEIWTPSLGEMVFGGNLAVQQSNSSRKKFYWEIYQLAGDPTLVPWFSRPGERAVIHPDLIPPGATRIDITCSPHDYVAVSKNGVLIDSKHSSGDGFVTLFLQEPAGEGVLDLVVTGDRYRPFMGEIQVGEPAGAYLDLLDYNLAEESVEEDQLISCGEQFSLDLQLINRGAREIHEDTLLLFTNHKDLEVKDSLIILDSVAPGDTVNITGSFRIKTGPLPADQTMVVLGLYRNSNEDNHKIYIREKIHAPVLNSGGILWEDRTLGNGNGVADPGERLACRWIIFNTGHFRTGRIWGFEQSTASFLFAEVSFDTVPFLNSGDTVSIPFRARISETAEGLNQSGAFTCGDDFVWVSDSFFISPGRYMEDFSVPDLDRFPFSNSSPNPWLSDGTTFMSSPFSLRSGAVKDYGSSEISIRFSTVYLDTLSFSTRVSSETGYDFLNFYLDSALVQSWSGEQEWRRYDYSLDRGPHLVTWTYRKDQAIRRGADAAWIDDIVFPVSAFRQADLSLVEIVAPESGPWLTENEQARILVSNSGMDTIHGFTAGISLEGGNHYSHTINLPLPPWKSMEHTLEGEFDLSGMDQYRFSAWITSNVDTYTDNDSVTRTVEHYSYPDISLKLSSLDQFDGVYADAIISVENLGNIYMDSLFFELLINDSVSLSGSRPLGVDPGQMILEIFRLLDASSADLSSGYYNYTVRSVKADSVLSNNEVNGMLYWQALDSKATISIGNLLLYPNPASDGFHILMPNPVETDLEISIINSAGMIEGGHIMETGEEKIYIATPFSPGIYTIKIGDTGIVMPLVIKN